MPSPTSLTPPQSGSFCSRKGILDFLGGVWILGSLLTAIFKLLYQIVRKQAKSASPSRVGQGHNTKKNHREYATCTEKKKRERKKDTSDTLDGRSTEKNVDYIIRPRRGPDKKTFFNAAEKCKYSARHSPDPGE